MARRRTVAKRRRYLRSDKPFFWAGTRADGTPRDWKLIDLTIAAICVAAVILGVYLMLGWLLGIGST